MDVPDVMATDDVEVEVEADEIEVDDEEVNEEARMDEQDEQHEAESSDKVDEELESFKTRSYPDPSLEFLSYQEQLYEEYYQSNDKTFFYTKTSKKRDYTNSDARVSSESYVKIYEYGRSHQLSHAGGDDLLKLLKGVVGDQSLSIPLPETYEAIELACMRGMKESLHRIESSVYKLPDAIFKSSAVVTKSSSNVSSSVPKVPPVPSFLHEVTSHRFNLIERICHRLLDIDPDMFSSKPTNDSTRSYFSSGSVFRNLCNVHKDARAVPLCISISLDSATVNSARNRSECPVLFSILNVNEAATYQLIGYCPILLPYTDQVLAEKLAAYSGDLSRLVMQYLKRQMKRQYLNDILEPLLSLGTSGFVAQVGTGSKAQRYNFIPYLCMIVGDSEELGSKITGTSEKTGCRCCTTKHVEEYDPNKLAIHELRNDKDMDDVTSEGEQLFLERLEHHRKHGANKPFRVKSNPWRENVDAALRSAGLHAGANPLYKYFEFQSKHGINSYHRAVVPDHLHTIQLGLVVNCITWTMQIVFAVKYLDDAYGHNTSVIDQRIIKSNTLNSYRFIETVYFR